VSEPDPGAESLLEDPARLRREVALGCRILAAEGHDDLV
jgi:hypothetical protein